MIKESITDGIRWAMFEPNHPTTWGQLRRDIGAFLSNVWRDGALFGMTEDEAFFVKCDEETNPPAVRNEGRLVIVVGISVVRPAEFIVFKLMQTADQTQIETPGG